MPTCSPKIYSELSRSSGGCCPTGKKSHRIHRLNQEQIYEGEFLRGSMHGEGTYKWKDLGVYEGGFYSNHKEGYALMSYPDNSSFEGLFVRNQRFGPGIYTHPNGRQDAGFWMGRKLVRLSRAVDFIVPRLAPTTTAKIKLLQFRRLIPIDEEVFGPLSEIYSMCGCPLNCLSCPYSNLIFDPRSYFFDRITFERIYFLNSTHASEEALDGSVVWGSFDQGGIIEEEVEGEGISDDISIPSHCLCADKEFVMEYEQSTLTDICEKECSAGEVEMGILAYFTHHGTLVGLNAREEEKDDEVMEEAREMEEEEEDFKEPKLLEWNRSELCSRMLQQIFRYRDFEGRLTFNIAKLMLGARTEFRRTGEKEMQCVEFLKTCATGPPQVVKTMLCDYDVSEELTDARGNNSVMFAAATDQQEIIDILANYGADLNSFNDESLTPLNLCLLRRLAQVHDLGNWEIAFLVHEMDKTGEQYEVKEWRKRMSIQSLDRIFGDGKSVFELDNARSANACQDRDSTGTKSRSLLVSNVSSGMALPSMSKSLLDTTKVFISEKSPFLSCSDSQSTSRTKSNPRIVRTEEFEKSVKPSDKGSYFFELAPEKQRKMTGTRKESLRMLRKPSKEEEGGEEMLGEQSFLITGIRKKILDIDKTIENLLSRGADPNISEVPKPSIHLGVYSRDSKIVNLLLSYGANPNSQLYPNEGLLTPLHVLVLLKTALENVDICDLLLNFGADSEKETLPEFAFTEEEKPFLDLTEGRTPLQLLCMRPDLEYSDPENYLIKIALKLAEVSDKTRFYNGYSYLALAMSFGNLKLLKAFLDSKLFEPNALLGNDMGTVLHLLVSTEFQKKTAYDTSIQICDYLLEAGANPLKRLSHPEKLVGNCIDYGYREIDAEKASRKLLTAEKKENGKKSSKKSEVPEKPSEKDHLTDHVRVMEYLCKRVEEMKKKKKGSKDKKQSWGNVAERRKSSKIIANEKPNEVNESEAKVEEKVEEKKVENKEEKKNNDDGLAKEESEVWKEDDDEDNDDDETKEEGEEEKKKKKKKRRKSDGNKEKKKNVKRKEKSEKPSPKKITKKTDSSVSKLKLKNSVSKSVSRKQPCLSETFPESLRQSVLKIFGNCTDLDINELLLPYVVLRDGDLYYSVNKKGSREKEQYSLV